MLIGAQSPDMFPNVGGLCLMAMTTPVSPSVCGRPITKMTFGEYFGHNVCYVRHYVASLGKSEVEMLGRH
jgi:hypothetical protein